MGQKTHPTGFRVGINKPHSASWYAGYDTYGSILREDYRIRQFFEKEWGPLYNKAGIAKLEIRRKVNKLEFLIHAARPKAIAVGDDEEYTFVKLRDALNKLLDKPRHIRIKVIQITKAETESTLIARSLADQLEKRVAFKRAIRQVAQRLEKAGVKGAEMARAEWAREGRVPLQTLRADISYATDRAYTTYGVLGIKVWIFNKEII